MTIHSKRSNVTSISTLLTEHAEMADALRRIAHLTFSDLSEANKVQAAIGLARATLYQFDIPLTILDEDAEPTPQKGANP